MNRQMNFADFTGIYLYPEAFGTQYVYDKNGNRKTRKMLYGGQEKSEFDDADNLTKHTAAGRTVSSTFHYGDTEAEQKKHLLLKSIAPLGSASVFTYDAFGNPLTSQVQNADANPSYFIRGETSYTNDGNYVTEQKDARGKIVRTETDPQRGTTTSVTDAKGQTVTYEYDNLRRIVKTSAKTGAEAGIPTVHNEYTYDEQRGNLVEIRHNTDGNAANDVVYSFEQDALGRQTAVKVGNQTLSQSQYQNDPTKPNFGTLTATTYGNGAKIIGENYGYLVRSSGAIAIPFVYGYCGENSEFVNDYAVVEKREATGECHDVLITTSGEEIAFPEGYELTSFVYQDKIVVSYCFECEDEYSGIYYDFLYGLGTTNGEIYLRPQYDYISNFHEGYACIQIEHRWGHMDADGNIIVPPIYDLDEEEMGGAGYYFENGVAKLVLQDGNTIYINYAGEEVAPDCY